MWYKNDEHIYLWNEKGGGGARTQRVSGVIIDANWSHVYMIFGDKILAISVGYFFSSEWVRLTTTAVCSAHHMLPFLFCFFCVFVFSWEEMLINNKWSTLGLSRCALLSDGRDKTLGINLHSCTYKYFIFVLFFIIMNMKKYTSSAAGRDQEFRGKLLRRNYFLIKLKIKIP